MARRDEPTNLRQNTVDRIIEKSGVNRRTAQLDDEKLSRDGSQNMLASVVTEAPRNGATREMFSHRPPDGDYIGWYQETNGALLVYNSATQKVLSRHFRNGYTEFPNSATAFDFYSPTRSLETHEHDHRYYTETEINDNLGTNYANWTQLGQNFYYKSEVFNKTESDGRFAPKTHPHPHTHTYTRTNWTNDPQQDGKTYMISGFWETVNTGSAL